MFSILSKQLEASNSDGGNDRERSPVTIRPPLRELTDTDGGNITEGRSVMTIRANMGINQAMIHSTFMSQ